MDLLLPLLIFLWSRDRDRQAQPPQPPTWGQPYPYPQPWGGAWYGPWTQTYPQPPAPQGQTTSPGWPQPSGGSVPWMAPPIPPIPPQPTPPGPTPGIWVWGQGGVGPVPPIPPWPGPGQGQPPTVGPARPWRRIKSGDTGYGLAQRATGAGGRWRELLEVNPELTTYTDNKKQTQIRPWAVGQKIFLPLDWAKVADGIEPGLPLTPPTPPGTLTEARR